jgi:hypothetical protein
MGGSGEMVKEAMSNLKTKDYEPMNTTELVHAGHVHPRQAECHRCGWPQPLTKVSRHQRVQFSLDHSVRWVCDECMLDLAAAASPAAAVAPRKLTVQRLLPGHYRSVA